MTFSEIGVSEPIQRALTAEGYQHPTPIQSKAIPAILARKDLLGCAQTGTGKTAAFCIPILQLLHADLAHSKGSKGLLGLILTPTRELAIQINESLQVYGRFLPIKSTVIFGGVSQHGQTQELAKKPQILVATPGRLLDLMQQGLISLDHIRFFVLDEADRMLDMGFVHDVKRILAKLPRNRQNLFFSATMPGEITSLANEILHQPVRVEVAPVSSTAERIDQHIFLVDKANKKHLLQHLLKGSAITRALVFTKTKFGADKVAKELTRGGITALAIHGNKSQNARQKALNDFKSSAVNVLVATDIAARGIDVEDLTHVINYELPNVPETYVHRIGRTGRANASGVAFSFCEEEEVPYLRDIQKLIGKTLPIATDHPFPSTFKILEGKPKVGVPKMNQPKGFKEMPASSQKRRWNSGRKRWNKSS